MQRQGHINNNDCLLAVPRQHQAPRYDLVFGWDLVDVYKWRQSLTNVRAQHTVARVFSDLETEEELVVRGLCYDDANDDIVLYLHLMNDWTTGEIDKGVINPRETVD